MDKEYAVLNHIYKDGSTTQREIANDAGISVGAVNILVKNMIRKGLIKIERMNTKTLRYILTPQGMQEKMKLTYKYASSSYRKIIVISEYVKDLVEKSAKSGTEDIVLFGPDDEVREIVKMGLVAAGQPFACFDKPIKVKEYFNCCSKRRLLLVWRTEEELAALEDVTVVNVLDKVTI